MVTATLDAATQLRFLLRSAGVVGIPGIRIKTSSRGIEVMELLIEDRRGPDDDVYESRGIRFYLDFAARTAMRDVTLDFTERDFVLTEQ